MLWTLDFWKGAGERALKTFFQSFVAILGTSAVVLQDVDWLFVLSGAALATILSVATSIGNADFVAGAPAVTVVTTTEVTPPTTLDGK